MKRKPKYSKAVDNAVGRALAGVQINVMDILRVYEFARKLEEEGLDAPTLDSKLRAYVETIRIPA